MYSIVQFFQTSFISLQFIFQQGHNLQELTRIVLFVACAKGSCDKNLCHLIVAKINMEKNASPNFRIILLESRRNVFRTFKNTKNLKVVL